MGDGKGQDRVYRALEERAGEYLSGEELAQQLGITRGAVWKSIKKLQEEGHPIESLHRRGYRLLSTPLEGGRIAALCGVPGLRVEVYNSLPSTNTYLRQRAEEGETEGLVVITQRQTAGRGRRANRFFSPPGTGLYLSLLLRPTFSAQQALLLTTCGAVAAARAAEALSGRQADIKWVNDLYMEGKKVCGILTEGAVDLENGGLRYAIVGVGMNLFPPEEGFPPEIASVAGSIFPQPLPGRELREEMAGAFLKNFFADYPRLTQRPFYEDYRRRCFLVGRQVTLQEGETVSTVQVVDLAPDFSLVVREENGRERTVSSGEARAWV